MVNVPVQRYSIQRRYQRYPVDRAVAAVLQSDGSPFLTIPGRCRTFSEGGLGATMTQQLTIGQVVSLQQSNALRVYAAVRNLHGYNHGFEFVLLRDAQRSAVQRLCQTWRGL